MLCANFKAGDVLGASVVNEIITALRPPGVDYRCGPGLTARQGPDGQVQLATNTRDALVGKVATGGITAFSSSTPGTGTVEIWTFDPSTGELVDAGYAVAGVLNLSTSIASSQWVWIEEDANGNWWAFPASSTAGVFFCQTPSSGLSGASGTWPSLTASSFTANVYQVSGASLSLVASSATVRVWFPASPLASRVTILFADGSGGYVAGQQSCS